MSGESGSGPVPRMHAAVAIRKGMSRGNAGCCNAMRGRVRKPKHCQPCDHNLKSQDQKGFKRELVCRALQVHLGSRTRNTGKLFWRSNEAAPVNPTACLDSCNPDCANSRGPHHVTQLSAQLAAACCCLHGLRMVNAREPRTAQGQAGLTPGDKWARIV